MTVYENLLGMLEDAKALRRPAAEIKAIEAEIARFDHYSAALEALRAKVQKEAQSWCYVAPEGGTFYVTEAKAKAMQATNGGAVYPPVAA